MNFDSCQSFNVSILPTPKSKASKSFTKKTKRALQKPNKSPKIINRSLKNVTTSTTLLEISETFSEDESFASRHLFSSTPKSQKTEHQNNEIVTTSVTSDIKLDSSRGSKGSKVIYIPYDVAKIKFNSSIFSKLSKSESQSLTSKDDDMLPSMPSLSRCSSPNQTVTNAVPVPQTEQVTLINESNETLETVIEDKTEKDNIDDINALMVASSTIKSATRKRQTAPEKKRAKLRRELSANLRMLSVETPEVVEEKNNRFVHAFYDKIQEQLDLHDWHCFMEALNSFDEKRNTINELYQNVENIIGVKHPDLLEEFLTFFTSDQVKRMGKLVPFLLMKNISLFVEKLEMYYKDQPSLMRKVYRTMNELTQIKDVTMTQVKNAMLPFLKSVPLLIDWFYQVFPFERPPERLYGNSWETIEIGKENSFSAENCYENIVIPEVEDPYGGVNCICSCHDVEDPMFEKRLRHCIPCGTKFIQGRVYIHTGKTLRQATINFEDNKSDHFSRLSPHPKNKRIDSPMKHISPGKDSQDDRNSSDDEVDKKSRTKKNTKKRKPKKKIIKEVCPVVKEIEPSPEISTPVLEMQEPVKKDFDQNNENTSDSSLNEVKNVEENMEWDCNTSIESIELKLTPEHVSAESESISEFCEETSQDNSDTEASGVASGGESGSNSPAPDCVSWTRDEDKTILETLQKEEDKDRAFQKIAEKLEHRTLQQIMQRFELLFNLLKEMSRKNS